MLTPSPREPRARVLVPDARVTQAGQPPRVLAAVVNYNRADLTLAVVSSLLGLAGEARLEVLVVDSSSAAADVERLRNELPDRVDLLDLPVNRGYGAACNVAIRRAIQDGIPYVWLLNNDVAFDQGALRNLVEALEGDADLAAVAPAIVEYDHPDLVLGCGMDVTMRLVKVRHRFWQRSTAELPTRLVRVDALEGSALLLRTEAAVACGGFDEGFFMYWEDLDWSLRARKLGWTLACAPGTRVRHRLSQSSMPLDRIEYMIRNRIRVVRLHGSHLDQAVFMAYMVFGWLPAYAVTRLLTRYGPTSAAKATVRPLLWNLRDAVQRGRWRLTSGDQETGLDVRDSGARA